MKIISTFKKKNIFSKKEFSLLHVYIVILPCVSCVISNNYLLKQFESSGARP